MKPWDYDRLKTIAEHSDNGEYREVRMAIDALKAIRGDRYRMILKLAEGAIHGNKECMSVLDEIVSFLMSPDSQYSGKFRF